MKSIRALVSSVLILVLSQCARLSLSTNIFQSVNSFEETISAANQRIVEQVKTFLDIRIDQINNSLAQSNMKVNQKFECVFGLLDQLIDSNSMCEIPLNPRGIISFDKNLHDVSSEFQYCSKFDAAKWQIKKILCTSILCSRAVQRSHFQASNLSKEFVLFKSITRIVLSGFLNQSLMKSR